MYSFKICRFWPSCGLIGTKCIPG